MDKKSFLAAFICILLIFAWQAFVQWQWGGPPDPREEPVSLEDASPAGDLAQPPPPSMPDAASAERESTPSLVAPRTEETPVDGIEPSRIEENAETPPVFTEEFATLETELLRLVFSNRGGGIVEAVLKDPAENGGTPIFLPMDDLPALAVVGIPGAGPGFPYRMEMTGENRLRLTSDGPALRVVKDVALDDGYGLSIVLSAENRGTEPVILDSPGIGLGTARSLGRQSSRDGQFLGIDILSAETGKALHKRPYRGPETVATPAAWAAVKNKYSVVILTPDDGFVQVEGGPVPDAGDPRNPAGVVGRAFFAGVTIPPGGRAEWRLSGYIGPKKVERLEALANQQDQVLEFGTILGGISKFLLAVMNFFYRVTGNYGVAIILLTILIKLLFWPITQKSTQSMRRMQELQPLVSELRKKFKDDPQRLQQETMKLYKEHRVNPMGGCLPLVIQLPVFFALFKVLRVAVELRGATFLWVKDLSEPDTVFTVPYLMLGRPLDINPLAILMGITMLWQQRMTPTAGDPNQAKMMMFMPIVFTAICYTFPSGLTLYWTVNQVLTIVQQYVSMRGGKAGANHARDARGDGRRRE